MKKTISLLLSFVMLFSIISGLDVTAYAANYYESENNNSYSTADNIQLNSTMYGKCTNSSDDDWYKFALPSRGIVNVSFSFTPKSDSGYWDVSIYKYKGSGDYSTVEYESIYLTDGSYTFSGLGLDTGTYFIKVNPNGAYGTPYGVTVNYYQPAPMPAPVQPSYTAPSKPKKPSIKTPSTSKKHKITAKWKKVSGCSGYQVQFSTKKNFKKSVTKKTVKGQKKTSCTAKLKKGKKYYIRVRAYKTVNGKKYYSSWSKVKSIKCK